MEDMMNDMMQDQNNVDLQPNEEETLQFNFPQTVEQTHSIIKVVGVGGGGSNAVRNMYEEGIQDVTYLIINTDKAALKNSPIPNKLQISEEGLGAGADPDMAEAYALQYEENIRTALSDGTKMVFITAGMGGGTGTGASPVVARVAHELGILTIGIVTIPFKFEGQKKIMMALKWVEKIRKHVDALLVVNNNRLTEIYPDLNFFNAFKKADDTLTIAAKSISDIINITGYINLDFADVKKTLKDSGVALISTGQASGENRLSAAIDNAIKSPLLQDNEVTRAQRLLFEVCFSESNPLSMSEIEELNAFVDSLDSNIEVIWGALQDDTLGDDVRIILLAAGFEMDGVTGTVRPASTEDIYKKAREEAAAQAAAQAAAKAEEERRQKEEAERIKKEEEEKERKRQELLRQLQALDGVPSANPEPIQQPAPQPTIETPQPAPQPEPAQPVTVQPTTEPIADAVADGPKPEAAQDVNEALENIRKFYGEETAEEYRMDQIRKNYYLLDNADLTNEQLVSMLEHMPAYNRSYEQLCELKKAAQQKPSQPSSSKNDGSIF